MIALTLVCFGAVIAGTLGVGGGGVFLPVLVGVARKPPTDARVLCSCCVLSTVVAATAVTALREKRQKATLIDLRVLSVVGAFQIAGGSFGTLVVGALPPATIKILAIVASIMGLRSLWAAYRTHVQLRTAAKAAKVLEEDEDVEAEQLPLINTDSKIKTSLGFWIGLICLWLFTLACTLLQNYYSGLIDPTVLTISRGFVPMIHGVFQATKYVKRSALEGPKDGLLHLTYKKALVIALCSMFFGLLSSATGIGGGMLVNPMLLAQGIPPLRLPYTVSALIAFSTSNYVVNMMVDGLVKTDALYWALVALVGSVFGRTVVDKIMHEYQLVPHFLAALGIVVIVAALKSSQEVFSFFSP